jgi:hypothetical protein
LKDESGKYIRSACLINTQSDSYNSAASTCRANNMELFKIDNANSKKALMEYVDLELHHSAQSSLWINDISKFDVYTSNCSDSKWSICQFIGGNPMLQEKGKELLSSLELITQLKIFNFILI